MSENTYSTHLYLTQQEMEATTADMLVLIEGLGRNILKYLGNVELGKLVRIFLRDRESKTVGGSPGKFSAGGFTYHCYGLTNFQGIVVLE